ncbi:MAG: hypothetical protein ABIY55_24095 [Kofleriaceae bacterium]
MIAGCTASADQVHPKPEVLAFPSGLAITPNEKFLFVANANSELRYDSGSIGVLDVDAIQSSVEAWLNGGLRGDCDDDVDHAESILCDAATFLKDGGKAGVRIGNFATDIALQDFSPVDSADPTSHSGPYRVFVPTRGDPSVAWADFVDGALSCSTSGDAFDLCDDAHRLSTLNNDPDLLRLPEEPFGVYADGPTGVAVVSHLNNGTVTLIAAPPPDTAGEVRIVDVRNGFFNIDVNGSAGATGITARPVPNNPVPGDPMPARPDNIIYVGSRSDHRVQTFSVGTLPLAAAAPEAAYLVPGNYFFLTDIGNVVGGSTDTRGMKISDDGNRLFLVNRQPPTLQIYDTSIGPTGAPRNTGIGGIDICRQASTVTVLDNGDGERAYVTCFLDGQIYVVDPRNLTQPEDILLVGRGPYSVVGATKGTRKLLFVSNFLEDTIAVVNVTPGELTYNRVVLRIGTPRVP